MFRVLTPIIRSSYNCNYSFWHWSTGSTTIRYRCWVPTQQRERTVVDLQAASSVHYTTSCKQSLALLRLGEIIARNMSSWLKLLIKLLLLHLVGCLYYCINDARSHKHQIQKQWAKSETKQENERPEMTSQYWILFLHFMQRTTDRIKQF